MSWPSRSAAMRPWRRSRRASESRQSCLRNWLHAADVEAGSRPGVTASESAELRDLRCRNRLLEQEIEVLRRAAAYFAQPHLMHALFLAHRDDPEFGYRLLGDEARAAGFDACDRTMWRLCAGAGWWSVFGKRRPKGGKRPGPPVHDDLVLRNFTAPAPDRLWLTDITEHPVGSGGKLYLCAIKDVFSNRSVGYSMSDRMTSQLAVDALTSAVARRGGNVAGCTVHSDRGSRSRRFLAALREHGLLGSMGQVASAGDNAAMESFFSLLQNNVLNRRRWATRTELRLAIITWIERTYHRRRRQAWLGRMTPIEYEMIMTAPTAPAA